MMGHDMAALIVISIARLVALLAVILPGILMLTWYATDRHFSARPRGLSSKLISAATTSVFITLLPLIVLAQALAWTFRDVGTWLWGSFMLLWSIPALAITLRNRAKHMRDTRSAAD